jgi:Amt family ammonium transporter
LGNFNIATIIIASGAVVAVAWTTFFSLLVFVPLRHFGRLRVDQATELAGIDNMEHGGPAYPEFNLVLSPQHTEQ